MSDNPENNISNLTTTLNLSNICKIFDENLKLFNVKKFEGDCILTIRFLHNKYTKKPNVISKNSGNKKITSAKTP